MLYYATIFIQFLSLSFYFLPLLFFWQQCTYIFPFFQLYFQTVFQHLQVWFQLVVFWVFQCNLQYIYFQTFKLCFITVYRHCQSYLLEECNLHFLWVLPALSDFNNCIVKQSIVTTLSNCIFLSSVRCVPSFSTSVNYTFSFFKLYFITVYIYFPSLHFLTVYTFSF